MYRVDVTEVIPASLKTLDMEPDNPGIWMLHCHTNHHIHGGMIALFEVSACRGCTPPPLLSAASAVSGAVTLLIGMLTLLLLL